MFIYRLEKKQDYDAVEALTRDAFWNVYKPGCDEHYIVHCMRGKATVVESLNYVCLDGERICGHIFYTHTQVVAGEGRVFPMLSFGPISVHPAYQRQGIGSQLIVMTLDKAARTGHVGVAITGNPAYYQRFGFRAASEFGITAEDGSSFPELMVCELGVGRLASVQGRLHFCPEFMQIDVQEVERFDERFPPRERLRLPGQLF